MFRDIYTFSIKAFKVLQDAVNEKIGALSKALDKIAAIYSADV